MSGPSEGLHLTLIYAAHFEDVLCQSGVNYFNIFNL